MLPVRVNRRRAETTDLLDIFEEFQRDFDRLVRRFFGPVAETGWVPYGVDVWEDDDAVYVEAELPGVKPEDVDITLEGSILTIRGEKKDPRQGQTTDYHLRERRYGRFARSFQLPSTVDESKVTANLKDGVLTVRIEKKAEVRPRRIQVKAE